MKESENRKKYRLGCPNISQYKVGGMSRRICLVNNIECSSKSLCSRMRFYDKEVLGISHKSPDVDDVFDKIYR